MKNFPFKSNFMILTMTVFYVKGKIDSSDHFFHVSNNSTHYFIDKTNRYTIQVGIIVDQLQEV